MSYKTVISLIGVLILLAGCNEKDADDIFEDRHNNSQFEIHADLVYRYERHQVWTDAMAEPSVQRLDQLRVRIELRESVFDAFVVADDDDQLQVDYCGLVYDVGRDLVRRHGDAEYYELVVDSPPFDSCEMTIMFDHGKVRELRFFLPPLMSLYVDDEAAWRYDHALEDFDIQWGPLGRDALLEFSWRMDPSVCASPTPCERVYQRELNAASGGYRIPANLFDVASGAMAGVSVRLDEPRYDLDFSRYGLHSDSDVELDQEAIVSYTLIPPSGQ